MSNQTSIDVLESTGAAWQPRPTIDEVSYYSDGSRWIPITTKPVEPDVPTYTYTPSTNPSQASLIAKSRNSEYQIPAGKTGFESVGWDRFGQQLTVFNGDYTVTSTAPRDSEGWVTLTNLDIKGRFTINTGVSKVRLRKSRVITTVTQKVRTLGGSSNIILEDCEIDGNGGQGEIGVSGTGITLIRTWIHGCVDAVRTSYNAVLDTCLISDMAENTAQDHNDCMQSTSSNGSDPTSTSASTFLNTSFVGIDRDTNGTVPSNSAIILKPDTGGIQNMTFDGCYFSGGNYTVYLGNPQASGARPIRNIRFRNSIWGGRGKYGDLTLPDSTIESQVISEWTNNSKVDGSAFSCINYQSNGTQLNRQRTEAQLEAALNAT